jgi:hypothetical protein
LSHFSCFAVPRFSISLMCVHFGGMVGTKKQFTIKKN